MAQRKQAESLLSTEGHPEEKAAAQMGSNTSVVNLAEELRLYPSKIYSDKNKKISLKCN
jgi:hypothetical protein